VREPSLLVGQGETEGGRGDWRCFLAVMIDCFSGIMPIRAVVVLHSLFAGAQRTQERNGVKKIGFEFGCRRFPSLLRSPLGGRTAAAYLCQVYNLTKSHPAADCLERTSADVACAASPSTRWFSIVFGGVCWGRSPMRLAHHF